MPIPDLPAEAVLHVSLEDATARRRDEPVSIGLPLPKGWCADASHLALVADDNAPVALQARALDSWSDGSVRWALLDFGASYNGAPRAYRLRCDSATRASQSQLRTHAEGSGVVVDTGVRRFEVRPDGDLIAVGQSGDAFHVRLRVTDAGGTTLPLVIDTIACDETGPLRSSVLCAGAAGTDGSSLLVLVRLHFHAASSAVRFEVTVRNTASAKHEGGFWDLGDPASRLLRDVAVVISQPDGPGPWSVGCSPERNNPLETVVVPFELYQDSSGGEAWRSSNHVNRQGEVPLAFRGYRLLSGRSEKAGLRATPVIAADSPSRDALAIAHPQFWERFPKAITASDTELALRLLPAQSGDAHELQAGEQLTERFVVVFGEDQVSELPLDWVRSPLRVAADPQWYCVAEPMSYLTPLAEDPNRDYVSLVQSALDGPASFVAKRDVIDEFGWRHYGEIYADHETVLHTGPTPLVSHYNNQYDAVAGLAIQFFRSADTRWLSQMADLARHVVDVDVYHTRHDKAAYSRGLFWHTAHHTDAGRGTHRTYSRFAADASGGPSSEHNYSTGLMLHYFMTGDLLAREAVVSLAEWVIAMDDGKRTPFKWLSLAPTGLASATGSYSYHGPGRGPGNSIVSLLNAFRLTEETKYLDKAEELIRRCVHPNSDVPALDLLDAERKWFYTVFLQALGRYLDFKAERGELDEQYAYGREALLHFARWMAEHEYPYLEKPGILQHPTETWAAQDMRKSEVFKYAVKHSAGSERERFWERARFFFDYSVKTLSAMPTHRFARPTVLMLTNGYMHAYFQRPPEVTAPEPSRAATFGPPPSFVPQKAIAMKRVKALVVVGALSALAALVSLLL